MATAKRFELFMGCLGNGVTVCNKAVMENGDYKHVAHISPRGKITWYVKPDYAPDDAKAKIESIAASEKMKYDTWFDSLPKMKQYEIALDAMTASELLANHGRNTDDIIADFKNK